MKKIWKIGLSFMCGLFETMIDVFDGFFIVRIGFFLMIWFWLYCRVWKYCRCFCSECYHFVGMQLESTVFSTVSLESLCLRHSCQYTYLRDSCDRDNIKNM
jgi:hypothetical protein